VFFTHHFFNPSLFSQNMQKALAAMAAKKAQVDAMLDALKDDADHGDAVAGAVIAPPGAPPGATADGRRCACVPPRDPTLPLFYVEGVIGGAPPINLSEEDLVCRVKEMNLSEGTLQVCKKNNFHAASSFLRYMCALCPEFEKATNKILAADEEPGGRAKLDRSHYIVAVMDLFDLPPKYHPKTTMDSPWEALTGVFNGVRAAAGEPPLSEDDVKSMLEYKGGSTGWAAKHDVLEEKGMFPGGWRPVDGKFTVEGMVAGNAAKELPPGVRETFGPQARHQWFKVMSILRAFPGFLELLGGGNTSASNLRCMYRALRAHNVPVEIDDDWSTLWRKVVSTATGRTVGVEEARKVVKRDAVNRPFKIDYDAVNGDDVAKVEDLLARVLPLAKDLVREDKGEGAGKGAKGKIV
jgi:hypothetical protein